MEMVKMVYEEGEMIVHENSSVAMGYDANKQILMNVDLKDEQVHYEKRYDCFDIVDWVLQKENYKPDDIIKGIVIYDYKKSKPEVDKDLLTVE